MKPQCYIDPLKLAGIMGIVPTSPPKIGGREEELGLRLQAEACTLREKFRQRFKGIPPLRTETASELDHNHAAATPATVAQRKCRERPYGINS